MIWSQKKKEQIEKYKQPGNTGAYLAAFYAMVISIATVTLLFKSKIFSILSISEPEKFTQYTIDVAIGIIILYTILAYSKVITGLVSKLIDDIKGTTNSAEKPSSVTESDEKFF